jgi:hypothetical protein
MKPYIIQLQFGRWTFLERSIATGNYVARFSAETFEELARMTQNNYPFSNGLQFEVNVSA